MSEGTLGVKAEGLERTTDGLVAEPGAKRIPGRLAAFLLQEGMPETAKNRAKTAPCL
jgi:hypothetical protein